MNFWSENS